MSRCCSPQRLVMLVAAVVLLGLATPPALATVYTWDNNGGDYLWATGNDWVTGGMHGAAPGTSDTARLGNVLNTPRTVGLGGANRTVNAIRLENGFGPYTLPMATLSLGSGLFQQTANVSGTNTMNATVSGSALSASNLALDVGALGGNAGNASGFMAGNMTAGSGAQRRTLLSTKSMNLGSEPIPNLASATLGRAAASPAVSLAASPASLAQLPPLGMTSCTCSCSTASPTCAAIMCRRAISSRQATVT